MTQDDESRGDRLAARARYRAANKEKIAAYRAANKEKTAAYNAAYRAVNSEKRRMSEYQAAWRAARPAEKRAADRAKNTARMAAYLKTPAGIAAAEKRKLLVAACRQTDEYKAAQAAVRRRNAPKIRIYAAIARAKPEAKAKAAAYRARPEVKARQRTPEFKAARAVLRAARYAMPMDCLKRRMSSAVRSCLSNPSSKRQAKWPALVGYTPDQLRAHIERQFLPKMGWHNFSLWHIDHIVPLSAFRFVSTEDADFKAAWALTNLRPVWAAENLRKHARREFLL